MGCHFLLQGIILTQESNQGLLHCRQMICQLSYEGSLLFSHQWLANLEGCRVSLVKGELLKKSVLSNEHVSGLILPLSVVLPELKHFN